MLELLLILRQQGHSKEMGNSTRDKNIQRHLQCMKCNAKLYEDIDEYVWMEYGPYCADCFFDELSNTLDEHPIGSPAVRR